MCWHAEPAESTGMRICSPLPAILALGAACSTLGLAVLRFETPAGAIDPAPSMSAAVAPPYAPDPSPVTDPTPPPAPSPAAAADVAPARATPSAPADAPTQGEPPAPQPAPADPTPSLTVQLAEPVGSLPAAVVAPSAVTPDADKAVALLAAMNAARAAEGVEPLTWDPELADVAFTRARDLLEHDYFDHYGPGGRSAFSELAVRGIRYRLAGENLARNNYPEARTVEAAFQGLMGSPGHRANILEPRFTRVGIAAVRSGRTWLYVTVFMD